ncbi:MAG: thiopeptide-type bacteriocin biosynthesis protein [Woeseiaceae bacterium]
MAWSTRFPASQSARTWLSAHIYFNGALYSATCDRLITDVVGPFGDHCRVKGWIDGYFFVRYGNNGPHVRFRMSGDKRNLENLVMPALLEYLHLNETCPWTGGATPNGITAVEWVPYEPELDRYGGEAAIRVAERFFCCSSQVCTEMLREIEPDDRSSRLGKALLTTTVLLHAFCQSKGKAASLAGEYRSGYLRSLRRQNNGKTQHVDMFHGHFERQAEALQTYVDAAWARMDNGEELSHALDSMHVHAIVTRRALQELAHTGSVVRFAVQYNDWEKCVQLLMPSYIHMTNNRMGIQVREEIYLAYLLERTMAESLAVGSSPNGQ